MKELAQEFLDELWKGKPANAAIEVWHKDTKKTYTFSRTDDAAAKASEFTDSDVYMAAGLGPKVFARAQTKRITADTAVGIPGVWADIDVNGGPEGKTGAAPSIDAAIALATEGMLEPTILVNSGYGIQAWWLLEEGPWIFSGKDGPAQRQQAARLVQAFQFGLRLRARRMGWNIDSTHDLARLMRLPGTFNCKGDTPAPVNTIEYEGVRHSLTAIGAAVQEHMGEVTQAIARVTGEGINIVLRGTQASPPMIKLEQLMEIDDDFADVWQHKPVRRLRGWSMNQFEMSIANSLVRAGFTDQECADCIVYHRLKHGDPKGKANRLDYIAGTIGKARQSIEVEELEEELEQEREEAVEQLSSMPASGGGSAGRAALLFSKVVGGPEIKELIQDGRDPDTARFRLVLADSREVPIGNADALLDFSRFRSRYMVVTGHVSGDLKRADWTKVVQAMIITATVNDEDTRSERIHSIIEQYADRGISNDRNGACAAMDPWEDDDRIYVHAGQLTQWLRRVQGERATEADVRQLLIAGGFQRKTMGYVTDDGEKNTRSYWCIDKEALRS